MRSRLAIAFVVLIHWNSAADSIDEAAKTLSGAGKDLYQARLQVPESDPALQAIRKLESDGSRKAVAALADYLRKDGGHPGIKREALAALGRIGSKAAVAAIAQFEEWAAMRPKHLGDIKLGLIDYPSHHFSPYEQTAAAECTTSDGTVWALCASSIYADSELWIGKKRDNRVADAILIDAKTPDPRSFYDLQKNNQIRLEAGARPGSFRVILGTATHDVDLERLIIDSDHDGLTDVRERDLTTDPQKPDSDGDSVPDDKDGNPLVAVSQAKDDTAQIRQAVFLLYFGVNESRNAILTSIRDQEFRGYGGPVLWSPKTIEGRVNFSIEVTKLEADRATVQYGDYEGGCAASGNTVELKKIRGRWVVVSYRLDVIA